MPEDSLSQLQGELRTFAAEREWERFHTPQNLAALISTEAGELLALFRWGQDSLAERPQAVRHELADVFLGVLRFADVAGIDLVEAAREKIAINSTNYPPDSSSPDRRS